MRIERFSLGCVFKHPYTDSIHLRTQQANPHCVKYWTYRICIGSLIACVNTSQTVRATEVLLFLSMSSQNCYFERRNGFQFLIKSKGRMIECLALRKSARYVM